jgi:hypothetical protein
VPARAAGELHTFDSEFGDHCTAPPIRCAGTAQSADEAVSTSPIPRPDLTRQDSSFISKGRQGEGSSSSAWAREEARRAGAGAGI